MNLTSIILGVVAILQVIVLILVINVRRQGPQVQVTPQMMKKAFAKIHSLRNKLTAILWSSNSLLNGEYGKTTVAQQEFIHGISEECKQASAALDSALEDLRLTVTSKMLEELEGVKD